MMKRFFFPLLAVICLLSACSSNKSEDLNRLLEQRISDQFFRDNVNYTVREVHTVLKHDNEYKGEVEIKDKDGNVKVFELDATYDGHDVVYVLLGYKKPAAEPQVATAETVEEPAIQGDASFSGQIYSSGAYLSLNFSGTNVSGSYTADLYNYSIPVTGSIHGNKVSLQTREHGKVNRKFNGTIQDGNFHCNYWSTGGKCKLVFYRN